MTKDRTKYGSKYLAEHRPMEVRTLMNEMRVCSDYEVCEKIISLAKEIIKESGHDYKFVAYKTSGKRLE